MWRRNLNIVLIAFVIVGSSYCFNGCRSEHSELPLRGVAPQDERYFNGLLDGSKVRLKCRADKHITFTKSQLNDDFCDCPDGTDEPGTSACPRGKFYCHNIGYTPLTLSSSRVNDGICDCCDGSDEYDGRTKCPNTCWEAGKIDRDKLSSKIATFKEGSTIRNRLVQEAQALYSSDQAQLSKLREEESVLKPLVEQLRVHKERLEKAQEEKERKEAEQRESQNKNSDNLENLVVETKGDDDNEHLADSVASDVGPSDQVKLNEPADNEHVSGSNDAENKLHPVEDVPLNEKDDSGNILEDHVTYNENHPISTEENNDDKTMDELSKEDLGRHVASRWTGNKEKPSLEDDIAKDRELDNRGHDESQPDVNEEHAGYLSETDVDHSTYDDGDVDDDADDAYKDATDHDDGPSHSDNDEQYLSDLTSKHNPSWLGKIQLTVRNILQSVFRSPVNISDLSNVLKEYEETSSKLNKVQSRMSSLTEKLEYDYGVDKEFYSFYDKCFEGKQNKYVYKICPFKEASQVEGHSTTRLGRWDQFNDSYKTMVFSNGDRCWNGPDRTMKVKLRCGLKNEVTDIDEPSRCEYVAVLSTPVRCVAEKLQELEAKLEALKRERPTGRDEL